MDAGTPPLRTALTLKQRLVQQAIGDRGLGLALLFGNLANAFNDASIELVHFLHGIDRRTGGRLPKVAARESNPGLDCLSLELVDLRLQPRRLISHQLIPSLFRNSEEAEPGYRLSVFQNVVSAACRFDFVEFVAHANNLQHPSILSRRIQIETQILFMCAAIEELAQHRRVCDQLLQLVRNVPRPVMLVGCSAYEWPKNFWRFLFLLFKDLRQPASADQAFFGLGDEFGLL